MVNATRESSNGYIDLLVLGTDGSAWHGAATTNPTYATWTPLYGTIIGTPNGAQDGSTLDTYSIAPNGNLNCYRNQTPNTFEPWSSVPGCKAA